MGVRILARHGRRAALIALTGMLLALSIGLAGLLLLAQPARANHNVVEHVSQGVTGGNGTFFTSFMAASADGGVVHFVTNEQLVAADTDSQNDLYRRLAGTTELVSTGPAGGNSTNAPTFDAITPSGSHVFFQSADALVAGDTNTTPDAYMYSNGTTTLVSGGQPEVCPTFAQWTQGVTDDASKVYLITAERLDPADTDCQADLYVRNSTGVQILHAGPSPMGLSGVSSDGARAFFFTNDQVIAADTDSGLDMYMLEGSTYTLISQGPTGGNGNFSAVGSHGVARDGQRAYFSTNEKLVASDTDAASDTYMWHNGVVELVTTGATGGNGGQTATVVGKSRDGVHAVFTTSESLVAGDTDATVDVYDHANGVTSLVSTGPTGGNGAVSITPTTRESVSHDGSHVYFTTSESLVADDTDTAVDVYVRSGSVTSLVSTSPSGAPSQNASFVGASGQGSRAFFSTNEQLVAADTDSVVDMYERVGGTTHLITLGPNGGNGAFAVDPTFSGLFNPISDDGSRVFFNTREPLVDSDTDVWQDVYVATTTTSATGYPRPKGATSLRVSLVPAYRACAALNRTHGPPLAWGSCNPPVPESGQATTGSPDANGKPATMEAFAKYDVVVGNTSTPADESDVRLNVRIPDVRAQGTLADYAGSLSLVSRVRITDRRSGSGVDPATVTDFDLGAPVPCAATAGSEGALCSLTTTFDAIAPGAVPEGKRSVWALERVGAYDAGPDGSAATGGDNTLFAVQGLFVP